MPEFKVGTDDFKELLDQGGYLVDKSLLIRDVIKGNKATLLPRPRRFGKTLNLTMLRYFFEKTDNDNAQLFDGLKIAADRECMRLQGQYPTVFLSLKDVRGASWDEARARLATRIGELLTPFRYLRETLSEIHADPFDRLLSGRGTDADLKDSLRTLIAQLHRHHAKPVVVLIDEYDSPVIEAWNKGYYEPMIDFMRSWLGGGLKHEDGPALFRAVVTGILRVARESVFSGLNNLDVSTTLKIGPFSDKFGFTQAEVDKVLVDFDLSELAEPMRAWYDGYDFGGHVIYNPWSVIKCVDEWPNPVGPHWLNTASNTLIHRELERGGLELKRDLEKLLAGEELRHPVHEDTVFGDIGRSRENIWSFLCFSGYLRAQDPRRDPDDLRLKYRLSIPNQEVVEVYRAFVERHFADDLHADDVQELLQALKNDDVRDFGRRLQNLVLAVLSFYDATRKHPEAVYHTFVLGILTNLRGSYRLSSNVESGYGRADILMFPRRAGLTGKIIELKSLRPDEDFDTALAAALAQIEERQYEAQMREAGVHEVVKLAIAVQGKTVRVRRLEP